MSAGFTFIGTALGTISEEAKAYEPIVTICVGAGILFAAASAAARGFATAKDPIIPEDKMSARTFMELVGEFLIWLGDNAMGKHNRKYLPFAGAIFLFILVQNFLGLVPGMGGATANPLINAGVAIVVFVMYNYYGVKEVGAIGYLKHMCGPIVLLAPVIFGIEVISHLIRPLALTLRLYGNMTGDHLALSVFSDLTKGIYVPIPVIFYILGSIVCFVQAFVFTLLTMIYIRLATAHDDHGDDHEGAEAHGHAH